MGVLLLAASAVLFAQAPLPEPPPLPRPTAPQPSGERPIVQLAPGDQVKMEVFGRPEMATEMYVADDGTIRVPLAGPVRVAGLSPVDAAQKVETALKNGQFLVNPHVTLYMAPSLAHVSVLGEVKAPGRYPLDSSATILDILALAGGRTDKGDDVIYLLRQDAADQVTRFPLNLKGVMDAKDTVPEAMLFKLRGGDRILVPAAPQIYMQGEVRAPAAYRYESGMTVMQALIAAGGVTEKGSTHRIEIKRKGPAGNYLAISAKLSDTLQPDDVIKVKERIF
jgi:polysaccharide export outer membrane protein